MNPNQANNFQNTNNQFPDSNSGLGVASGFTPATAGFSSPNSNPGFLPTDTSEEILDNQFEAENLRLNSELGLVIPVNVSAEETSLYNAFFNVIRNIFRNKMLKPQEIAEYYTQFIPLNLETKRKIISGLEEIYNQQVLENTIIKEYFDEEEDLQKWQDLFDSLDAVSQEKLIYYMQTNQEMPKELLDKVIEEERKANTFEDAQPDEVVDEEAEAFARKNIEKVLRSRGFTASTLTAKDVSDLVNQNNSIAAMPVRPNIPPVRVPSRPAAPIAVDQGITDQQNIPRQVAPELSVPQNNTSNIQQFQQVNLPNIPVQPAAGAFPKPIGGLTRQPKGLDQLLNQ